MVYRNKLGLDRKDESSLDHRKDLDSLLQLSNCLREIAGINTQLKTETNERVSILSNFSGTLSYLDDSIGKRELADLLLATIKDTDEDNNVIKLPANNALLLLFRLMDVMTLV